MLSNRSIRVMSMSLLGSFSLFECIALFMDYRSLGFPDGHLTELDQFKSEFYPYAMSSLFLLSLGSVFLAFKDHKWDIWRKWTLGLFFVFNILLFLILDWSSENYNHGQGG